MIDYIPRIDIFNFKARAVLVPPTFLHKELKLTFLTSLIRNIFFVAHIVLILRLLKNMNCKIKD